MALQVTFDCADPHAQARFWAAALDYDVEDYAAAKAAKNRIHLDLHPGDAEAKVAQLLALGATKLWDGQLGPQTWVTLADPEGNELCVS